MCLLSRKSMTYQSLVMRKLVFWFLDRVGSKPAWSAREVRKSHKMLDIDTRNQFKTKALISLCFSVFCFMQNQATEFCMTWLEYIKFLRKLFHSLWQIKCLLYKESCHYSTSAEYRTFKDPVSCIKIVTIARQNTAETRNEKKNCLQDFRLGSTQSNPYSHRRWFET